MPGLAECLNLEGHARIDNVFTIAVDYNEATIWIVGNGLGMNLTAAHVLDCEGKAFAVFDFTSVGQSFLSLPAELQNLPLASIHTAVSSRPT